jgi:hypothetical protein
MIAYRSGNSSVRTIPFWLVLVKGPRFPDKLWQDRRHCCDFAAILAVRRTCKMPPLIPSQGGRDVLGFTRESAAHAFCDGD